MLKGPLWKKLNEKISREEAIELRNMQESYEERIEKEAENL